MNRLGHCPRWVSYAAARSSLSAPRITILSASSGNGRCNAFASSHGARIQTSVVRITGIGFGWIDATIAFGAVSQKADRAALPQVEWLSSN